MKILQIGKFYPPYHYGGIETVSFDLHNALRNKGIQSDFLGFLPLRYKNDIIEDDFVYLCRTNINIFSTQFSISFIQKWLKERNNYDIIFINMPNPFVNLLVNFFLPLGKVVLFWHGDIIKYKYFLTIYKPALTSLIKRASAVIAPTNIHLEESCFKDLFVDKKYVISYPLNIIVKEWPYVLFHNRKVIFSCGRLIYYKGFDILIEAGKYLPKDCIMKIAGEGPLKKHLQEKIDKLRLNDKILLLGRIDNEKLVEEMRNCYLFCLPSNYKAEMFGVVQIEAFACGKPVISTNIKGSGVSEVNINNETGYTVKTNDPVALSEAIKQLTTNDSLYIQFSHNAIKRAKYFTSDGIIDEYIEIFQNLTDQID
jgi:rhamnosyl/mannosyltransferase